MIPTIPNIDRSDVNNLDVKHPLVRRGWQNMDDGIFISKDRKKDLNRYQEPYFIQDDQTYFVIFIKDNRVDRWIGLIRLIMWRVRFMRELFGNKKELYIWLWPTSWKKRIPKKIFTEDDINSGSTSLFLEGPHAKKNGEIILWRKEEVLKVLVHEIIHAFRIDEKDPSPKEAYVELRATIANIYLELLERQIPLNRYPQVLEKEKIFGRRQANRIKGINPGKTNIKAYLDERNRLLNKMNRETWRRLVNKNKKDHDRELRFTIAEQVLKKYQRKDPSGNVLNIP